MSGAWVSLGGLQKIQASTSPCVIHVLGKVSGESSSCAWVSLGGCRALGETWARHWMYSRWDIYKQRCGHLPQGLPTPLITSRVLALHGYHHTHWFMQPKFIIVLYAGLLEERGIDESRHGLRARPQHRRAFFSDSSSNLELDEVFQISQKLELSLAE